MRKGVGGLVVGLPLNMDGSDGPSAQSARAFGRNWANRIRPCPSYSRMSGFPPAPSPAPCSRPMPRANGADEVVDKMAAAYILQGALDRLRNMPMSRRRRSGALPLAAAGLRPPVADGHGGTERIFLLVGAAALFAGYDMNIFGLATPQIQASLHIPENQIGADRRLFPPGRRSSPC